MAVAGSRLSASSSGFMAEQSRVLPKSKVKELVGNLKPKQSELSGFVTKEIASGQHLQVFANRQLFWEQCLHTEELEGLLNALFVKYVALLEACFKGREKYGTLQVEWMECIRLVQYECPCTCEAAKLWAQLVEKTNLNPSEATKSAILSSVARAVFTFCQRQILSVKEGSNDEEEIVDSPLHEAGLTADEAALYRLGGFALYAVLKASTNPETVHKLRCQQT